MPTMVQTFSLPENRRLVEDFLAEVQLADGLAVSSVKALAHDLMQLERATNASLCALTEVQLHELLAQLNRRGVRAAGVRRQITSLRRFYRWAARQGLCADITVRLQAPRVPRAIPKALRPEQTAMLLEAAPEPLSAQELLRNRAMLELAYGSGLRAAEVCALELSWMRLTDGVLRVLGKGNRERLVPMSEPSVQAVQEYLEHARPLYLAGRPGTDALFVTRLGRAMTTRNFHDIVKKTARAAGLAVHKVSAHALRHSFATDLVDGGADIRAVQMLLGHESITTTTIYLRTSQARLHELIARHHPRG